MKNWIRSWFEAVEGYGDDPRVYDPTLDYRPLPRTTSDPQKGRETWKLNVTHHAERVARRMAEDPEYAEAYRLATEDIKRHDALHRHNSHILP